MSGKAVPRNVALLSATTIIKASWSERTNIIICVSHNDRQLQEGFGFVSQNLISEDCCCDDSCGDVERRATNSQRCIFFMPVKVADCEYAGKRPHFCCMA